jgi:lipoprotein-anchoring transpeptidase ErfK/SrfK
MSGVRNGTGIAASVVLLVSLVGGTAAAAPPPVTQPTQVAAQIRTAVATPSALCAHNSKVARHIFVNIASQKLWACKGKVLFVETAVTTGAWALKNVRDATPTGTWRIYSKVRNTVLAGHDANGSWRDPVKYWMPFFEGYGFHDASWQTFPYGSSLYKTKGSHGCVHVPLKVMAELFNWAPIGTPVTIVLR